MKRELAGVLFIALASPLFAQLLDNTNASIFSTDPFFNTRFIKENHIKTIYGEVAIKKQLRTIRQMGLMQFFEFNREGLLVRQFETYYKKGGLLDTTVVEYEYDPEGHITNKRMTDQYGFYSYTYTYDNEGRVISESYSREETLNASKSKFVAGTTFIIRRETFDYVRPVVNQLKKRWFNSQGKPYRELMTWYDSHGNKTEEEDRYIVTNKRSRAVYTYGDKHELVKMTEQPNVNEEKKRVRTFVYDELGNLQSEKLIVGGKHTNSKEYVYDPRTMLLSARLVKDEVTNTINITQYRYVFWE